MNSVPNISNRSASLSNSAPSITNGAPGIVLGLDLARRAAHTGVITHNDPWSERGKPKPFQFSHDLEGLQALEARLRRAANGQGLAGVTVNFEPAGGGWRLVAAYLAHAGARVRYMRTDVLSALRKVHSKFAKTDRIDALTAAHGVWAFPRRLIGFEPPEPRIARLRELSAQRQRFVQDATRWKARAMARLENTWGALIHRLTREQRFCRLLRAFYRRFDTPASVHRLGRERFRAWCKKNAHGATAPTLFDTLWDAAEKAHALWDYMTRAGAASLDAEMEKLLLVQDLDAIETAEKNIAALDQRLRQARADVPECEVLDPIPGFGPVVTATVAAAAMPVTRFGNLKKAAAHSGFTGRQHQTGVHHAEGLPITKTGPRRLKRDLALAADTAMRCDPQLAAFAVALLRRGKHYNKVRVAVGRKLYVRACSLLRRYHAARACAAATKVADPPEVVPAPEVADAPEVVPTPNTASRRRNKNTAATPVAYQWRDEHGAAVTQQHARARARQLWDDYNAAQPSKRKKGSPPPTATSWQSEDSKRAASSGELPGLESAPNPARSARNKPHSQSQKTPVDNLCKTCEQLVDNLKRNTRKKGLICP